MLYALSRLFQHNKGQTTDRLRGIKLGVIRMTIFKLWGAEMALKGGWLTGEVLLLGIWKGTIELSGTPDTGVGSQLLWT